MSIDKTSIIYPLPSDELFKRKENYWRVELPLDYMNFIQENNGARMKDGAFECNGHEYAIDRFLCLLNTPRDNVLGMYEIDVILTQIEDRLTNNEDLMGVEILPIVVLFASDFVCLDFTKDKKNPSVCVWDHEKSAELEPVTYFVADTFSEFISKIQ